MGGDLRLIVELFEHLVLTALPMGAAMLLAERSGVRSTPLLLAIGLAASGGVAMLSFWAYYGDRLLGESLGYLIVLGSAAVLAWRMVGGHVDRDLLRQVAIPFLLWALGSAFLLFFGFAHGGIAEPLVTSASRFSPPLPSDNSLPLTYAEWFFHHGHAERFPTMPGDWLSSDRPPLQVGYVLSQRTFGWDQTGLHYQVLAVLLQQFWIFGLWALLLAARVGRVTRALATATILVSDIAVVNGFYVWPKLLPAAMLLAAAALVATPLWPKLRRSTWGAALLATLLALSLLGHGASVFGVIPLLLIAAFRGLPDLRWLGVGLLTAALLLFPWSAYQRYGDPPGNRLTKWYLAGVEKIDDRGVVESILDSYGEVGVGGALHEKGQNFVAIVGGGPMVDNVEGIVDAGDSGDLGEAARGIRNVFFFNLVPSLGLLLLGPVAMAIGWRRRRERPAEWTFALTCLAIFIVGAICWGLLMFGPPAARTVIHVGSYLLPIIGLCGAAVGLRAVYPRFAVAFLAVNALAMLALYAPAYEPPQGTGYSALMGLLALVSLSGFLLVAFRPEPQRSTPTSAPDG